MPKPATYVFCSRKNDNATGTDRPYPCLSLCLHAESDAEAYSIIAAARVVAECMHIEVEASVHVMRLAVEAEAKAIRIRARTDPDVVDTFVQEMGRRRQEVSQVAAFVNKGVFVPAEVIGVASLALAGMAAGVSAELRK
jgi:hypothetical protein